jgi:ribonuclease III family protein
MLFNRPFMEGMDEAEKLRLLRDMPLKNLAHLGDAVFELYEREKETLSQATVESLHKQVVSRVNSREQARLLLLLKPLLSESEADIVRRARNLKPTSFRRNVEQAVLRQATAFEALIGYLYLTDEARLQELLSKTTD